MAYTLRLEQKTDKQLKSIMISEDISTVNKAVIHLVRSYETMCSEVYHLNKELIKMQMKYEDLYGLVIDKKIAEDNLNAHLSD